MKIEQKQLVEIIGLTAIFASLIFVGLQLILDRRVAVAQQYSDRAEAQRADYRTMIESDIFIRVQTEKWERGERPFWWDENSNLAERFNEGEISIEELVIDGLEAQMDYVSFDNLYFQYNQGLLDVDDWAIYRKNLKYNLSANEINKVLFSSRIRPLGELASVLLKELENE